MASDDPRFRGFHDFRYESNPKEEQIADLWARVNLGQHNIVTRVLDRGGNQHNPPEPSLRDYRIAATIIQWLATPIGNDFVEELVKNKIVEIRND